MKEIWIPVKNYEEFYQVSNLGRIKSLERVIRNRVYPEKIMKTKINKTQEMVRFKVDGIKYHFPVQRIVAYAFVSNPQNKPFVGHINGNTLDNRASNLKWMTMQEINKISVVKRPVKPEFFEKGADAAKKKFSKKIKNVTTGKIYNSLNEAAKEYNITPVAISYNCIGKTSHCLGMQWRFILCEEN